MKLPLCNVTEFIQSTLKMTKKKPKPKLNYLVISFTYIKVTYTSHAFSLSKNNDCWSNSSPNKTASWKKTKKGTIKTCRWGSQTILKHSVLIFNLMGFNIQVFEDNQWSVLQSYNPLVVGSNPFKIRKGIWGQKNC